MTAARRIHDLIRQYGLPVLLATALGVGAWFRFSRIFQSTWMLEGYDESRDMLVARHIVEYGDWVWRGPLASGSMNALMNSPVYYYILSVLWFIGRSPFAVMVLWSALLMSIVYMAYRTGMEAGDKQLGIIMALLFAVQPTLISNSRHISQPYLLPLFSVLFLWLFWRRSPMTLGKLCLLIIVLLFPMHIHYGSLLMLPAGFLWLGAVWIGGMFRKQNGLSWKIVPALVVEYFLMTWVWLTYGKAPFDQQFYLAGEMQRSLSSVLLKMQDAWIVTADNIWWAKDPVVVIGILVFFAACALWHERVRRNHTHTGSRSYWWMICFAVIPPLIAGFHGDSVHTYYMLGTLPVLLFIIAAGLRALLARNRYVGLVCIGIVLWIFTEQALTVVSEVPKKPYVEQLRKVANVLYDDYRARSPAAGKPPAIALAVLAGKTLPYDGWGTGALWYFLEEYFRQPLVRLDNYGTNFFPIIQRPSYFYVLCDHRGFASGSGSACTRDFRAARPYLLDRKEEKIYASAPFVLWLFYINPSLPVSNYNIAYPGL